MGDKVLHFFNTETQALLYNVRNDSDHATTVLQFIKDLSLALNCWFSPLLREVFLRVLRFSLSSKTSISKFQFDQELGRRRSTLCVCYLQIIIYYLFIYFIIKYISTPSPKLVECLTRSTCGQNLVFQVGA